MMAEAVDLSENASRLRRAPLSAPAQTKRSEDASQYDDSMFSSCTGMHVPHASYQKSDTP